MIETITAPPRKFEDFAAKWYERLKKFDGDKSAIKARIQNDSTKYHVSQLRNEVAAIDADFVDPLLAHIDAVLNHKFRGEFRRTFHDECYHECTDSAAARLFSKVNWATGLRKNKSKASRSKR